MMAKHARTYSREFKQEAVRLTETTDKTVKQIAADLGISRGVLTRWRRAIQGPVEVAVAFPGKGHQAPVDEELRRLQRENDVLRMERDVLKKAMAIFTHDVRWNTGHAQQFPIGLMCRVLEVAVSGYYAWKTRTPGPRQQEDERLCGLITQTFHDGRSVYGSPRVHAKMQQQGVRCGRKRVARLMQRLQLSAQAHTRKPRTTSRAQEHPVAPNRLNREFTATAPNQKWVGDITVVNTLDGWLYLAAVVDLYSRACVGWAMGRHPDARLAASALGMALEGRHPQRGLLHHTDRGSTYTSDAYQAIVATSGMMGSMSRTGNCWDNAVMESFFGTLKTECTDRLLFPSRSQAQTAIFEYVEVFYNRQRLHSTLGYRSPLTFEAMSLPSW
jgi:putative transposase